MLKKLREISKIDKKLLIKFYLNKNIVGKIIPYIGTKVSIEKNSKINIGNKLILNTNKLRDSNKETYLKLEKNAKFIVKDSFDIFYNGDICIFEEAKLEIGSGFMNAGAQIRCKKSIKIGERVAISRNVMIWDTDAHEIYYENMKNEIHKEVVIGNNVLIGNGSIILKGVRIGDNVVIGAGSIVTKDIPDNSLACGNPARVVKNIKGWK